MKATIKLILIAAVLLTALQLGSLSFTAQAQQTGTTLTGSVTATSQWTRIWNWTIDLSARSLLQLFRGDRDVNDFWLQLVKYPAGDGFQADGEICLTNTGTAPTENLTIVDEVQGAMAGGGFQTLSSSAVDVGVKPVLGPGETYCYPYQTKYTRGIDPDWSYFQTLKNVARVTITNYSGWLPGDPNCPGSVSCPFGINPTADLTLPAGPILVRDTIHVAFPAWGDYQRTFSDGGLYRIDFEIYRCPADQGRRDHTAIILETGQSASMTVVVECYDVQVTADTTASLTRAYDWTISKSADQSTVVLGRNQALPVGYSVSVDASFTDSAQMATGSIQVYNPAPILAYINNVSALVSPDIVASVDCGVSPPEYPSGYLIAPGQSLDCTFHTTLPDSSNRVLNATAALLNCQELRFGNDCVFWGLTTDFTATSPVDLSHPQMTEVDKSINVTDSQQGVLSTVTFGLDSLPRILSYSRPVGPFDTCGDFAVENIATFETQDTHTTGADRVTVNVHVPCTNCTNGIGYWKTHAGFDSQPDMVTILLPIWLGTPPEPALKNKSIRITNAAQAVQFLNYSASPTNGISKLYAQLLAAKLSIKDGADATAIASTISKVDAFLATHNSEDWGSLAMAQRRLVLKWESLLDAYNNGFTGPGKCSAVDPG